MKALRLTDWRTEPQLVDIEVPQPGPGQVLIRVGGAGACHSDLHLMEWPAGMLPYPLPFTLGHETAGWVEALGSGASGFHVGDPVAVYGPWGCGYCRTCRLGEENYCERAAELKVAGGGLGLDGGMAEYMLVPSARFLVPLHTLSPSEAAPLTDAGLTPYHAIKRSLHLLVPGSSAVVIGAGGLGHMGIQMLTALSPARVIAVDTAADKLELARQVGATDSVVSGPEAAPAILDLTHGQGAELVVDFVGADSTLALAAKVGRKQGHLTVVGLAGGKLPFDFFALPYESSLATTYWGSLPELIEVIALAEAGKIKPHVQSFPLDQAAEAYRLLKQGKLAGRAVIDPRLVSSTESLTRESVGAATL
jgi:alcohol dehydrogenase, propanol-preferring